MTKKTDSWDGKERRALPKPGTIDRIITRIVKQHDPNNPEGRESVGRDVRLTLEALGYRIMHDGYSSVTRR